MRGTESEVAGMISATNSMKTVSDSNTVMPGEDRKIRKLKKKNKRKCILLTFSSVLNLKVILIFVCLSL